MRFRDIPRFTSDGTYNVDIPIMSIPKTIVEYQNDYGLELNPDFQRGNVWTELQQRRWLEFLLKGGNSANIIRFNCPMFQGAGNFRKLNSTEVREIHMVCVDGLQRLTAMLAFLDNKVQAFGLYFNEFEDRPGFDYCLRFNVNGLQTRKEVLQWYLDLNSGGTVHTQKELERVRKLLAQSVKV